MPSHTHDAIWHREINERIERADALEVAIVCVPGRPDPDDPPQFKVLPYALDADTHTLVVERFRVARDEPVTCPVGSRVDVYILSEQMRLVAAHDIADVAPFQLNAERRVMATELRRVGDVTSAQRRASFRVDTTAAGFAKVHINPPGATGMKLKPRSAILVNLSAEGMGLLVEQDAEWIENHENQIFEVHMTLPNGKTDLVVPVRIRRHEPRRGPGAYLGLQFTLNRDTPEDRTVRETLARLTTDLQRDQLRRRRA